MPTNLTINGEVFAFQGDPRFPLLDALRGDFRLTGAKAVCNEGFCGACTVHVDGVPMASCLQPVGALEGKQITTIEGVGDLEHLNPVQQVFEDLDVVQCGMCFPGMVMTLTAFLKENPTPSRLQVKEAMTGNICRCTGYELIVDAVMSLQKRAAASGEVAK